MMSGWGLTSKRNVLGCLSEFLKSSQRILDVSTGTGAVILELKKVYPDIACEFVGTDLSFGMLHVAQRKFASAGVEVPLVHTHVKKLPFENHSFDIVTHFGGINTFEDIPSALKEWVRVLKPEGVLVVADEGLSPSARKTQRGAEIVKANSLFGLRPPLEHLPHQVKNVELRWVARDTFYVITCQKLSEEELQDPEYQTVSQ
jgi:SAM-dependent methyltransferase